MSTNRAGVMVLVLVAISGWAMALTERNRVSNLSRPTPAMVPVEPLRAVPPVDLSHTIVLHRTGDSSPPVLLRPYVVQTAGNDPTNLVKWVVRDSTGKTVTYIEVNE